MCGITGFYSKNLSTFNNSILKMNSALFHRGPDFSGVWQDRSSGIVFGHQRLSVLDLSSAGNQPMISSSGRFIITYNGEIYNHLEIRKELKEINMNINWKSNSDTETFLEAIEYWGIDNALKKVVGMFAFALWDKKNCSLVLARDRMGEKPLYYGWQGKGLNKVFIFGSELKALKQHPEFQKTINRDAIALLLRHNYIPDPYSIYKNIYKLLPGQYLLLKNKDLKKNFLSKPVNYWSLTKIAIEGSKDLFKEDDSEIQNNFEKILKDTVKKKMISDAPVGAFLSGGIDSSTLVSLMQSENINRIKTFTIGFNDDDFNEAKHAKKIAKHLNTEHTELYFSPKTVMEIIPKLPIIHDEPFSDNSQIPSFLISQLAKKQIKVAISGDGGDELFCGYNRYSYVNNWSQRFNLIPFGLRKVFANKIKSISQDRWNILLKFLPFLNQHANKIKGSKALEANSLTDLYYILFSQWQNPTDVVLNSSEPGTFLTLYKPNLNQLNNYEQMMVLDLISYLPNDILVKVDRTSMASSIETRVPLLDHKLIEYVWKIPHNLKFRNGQSKWILKQILKKYVPERLTERPKKGFGIPLHSWLRGPLRDWAENLLDEKKLLKEGYFDAKIVREKWDDFILNKKNWHQDLWNILMFQAWLDSNNKL